MKEAFFALAARLAASLSGNEVLLCNFSAELSDFVRFNGARVRQAGSVEQRYATLRLVRGGRHASAALSLSGGSDDLELALAALARLRETLGELPEDPWLLYNEEPQSTETVRRGTLLSGEEAIEAIIRSVGKRDLVGIYAAGTTRRGFANSLGQRNWHEVDSFNFDWSLYRQADQAVKASYAGFEWHAGELAARMAAAAEQLDRLALARRDVPPGEYRVFLAPRALEEIVGLLGWGGFSARSRATKQSPLLRMQSGQALSAQVSLAEDTAEGIAPPFQGEGFVRPTRVELIRAGRLADPLVSPRSAKEYGLPANGASGGEAPESLDMAGGSLEDAQILEALERGLYVSNLWYLNFSDRAAGRITGMTRFATFWVEGGRIAAPASPLRFDDTIYRLLGEKLAALTRRRELLLDPSTYGERSTSSARLPGALLEGLRFTL